MTNQSHVCALLTLHSRAGDIWDNVVGPILYWLAKSAPHLMPTYRMQLLLKRPTFGPTEGHAAITGANTFTYSEGDAEIIITDIANATGDVSEWALRYGAPDEALAARRWQTDIGLIRDESCWHVSIKRTYGLAPGYIGPDLPPPAPAPAPIIATPLATKYWSIAPVGDFAVVATPHILHAGTGSRLVAALTDATRTLPVVYISQTAHRGTLCDQDLLARILVGAAVVVVAAAPSLDRELDALLPQGFHCFGGAVRVYLPEMQLDNPRDALRHRYLPPVDLEPMQPAEVVQTVARGILSWNLAALPARHLTIDEVQLHGSQQRLQALRVTSERDGNDLREYVALLFQENDHLTKQVRTLTEQAQQATAAYVRLEADTDREFNRAARELGKLRGEGRIAAPTNYELTDVDALRELPEDLPAMLEAICRLFPARLRATERARKSAQVAAINRTREVRGAWRILYALATTMYDLVFAESAAGDLPRRFAALTGIEFAQTEGHQTKRDERMMVLRRDVDDQGTSIDITPHLKLGHRPPNILRVHFTIDRARRLLVIGHCGDHLDTFGTQWNK